MLKSSIQVQRGLVVVSLLSICGCGGAAGSSDDSTVGSSGSSGSSSSTGSPTSSPTGGESESESGGEELKFCETQHTETLDGQSVIICDVAFADPPFVHLPEAKDLGGGVNETYLALSGAGFTNGVETYPVTFTLDEGEAEGLRHAFVIYRVELDAMGKVKAYEPAVYIDERNFLRSLEGRVMEGTISRQTGDEFELDPTLPIQVTLGTAEVFDATIPGLTRYSLAVTVDNLSGGIKGEDGTCFPSMDSYGAENPFSTYPSALVFARTPSMHGLFDNVSVIKYTDSASVMSDSLFLSPLDLILLETPVLAPYEGLGHGVPGGIPSLYVHPVAASGDACTP